jgi:hypothetical protein
MNIIVNGFRPWFVRYLRVVAKICYLHGQRFKDASIQWYL